MIFIAKPANKNHACRICSRQAYSDPAKITYNYFLSNLHKVVVIFKLELIGE